MVTRTKTQIPQKNQNQMPFPVLSAVFSTGRSLKKNNKPFKIVFKPQNNINN